MACSLVVIPLFTGPDTERYITLQATEKALHAIAKSQRLNLSQLLRERFHRDRPDDLNIKEASNLIDQLKQRRE